MNNLLMFCCHFPPMFLTQTCATGIHLCTYRGAFELLGCATTAENLGISQKHALNSPINLCSSNRTIIEHCSDDCFVY